MKKRIKFSGALALALGIFGLCAITVFASFIVRMFSELREVTNSTQITATSQTEPTFELTQIPPTFTQVALLTSSSTTATITPIATPTAIATIIDAVDHDVTTLEVLRTLNERFGFEFVYIPPGEFTMGISEVEADRVNQICRRAYNTTCFSDFLNETPEHTVFLAGFWISKTEITNTQYQAFMKADGYEQSSLWTTAGWEWRTQNSIIEPKCWGEMLVNHPTQPVVCVRWYEAVAFANWLALETGLYVHIPTEAQWEKAARGTDGRRWPWGDEEASGIRLNYCDSNCEFDYRDMSVNDGYQYMAPVGSYPAGASPYGTLDMAGNALEWTNTQSGICFSDPPDFLYPYRSDDGRESLEGNGCRVVRGGGSTDLPIDARTTVRSYWSPRTSNYNFGYRVVIQSDTGMMSSFDKSATSIEGVDNEAAPPMTEIQGVTAQDSNLRSGPGTSYSIIGGLVAGESFVIVGRNDDKSWYRIRLLDGEVAWLAAFLVENPPQSDMVPLVADPFTYTMESPPSLALVDGPSDALRFVFSYKQINGEALQNILSEAIKGADVYGWYALACPVSICPQSGYLVAYRYFIGPYDRLPIWYVFGESGEIYAVNGHAKTLTSELPNAHSIGLVRSIPDTVQLFKAKSRDEATVLPFR